MRPRTADSRPYGYSYNNALERGEHFRRALPKRHWMENTGVQAGWKNRPRKRIVEIGTHRVGTDSRSYGFS